MITEEELVNGVAAMKMDVLLCSNVFVRYIHTTVAAVCSE